MRHSFLPNSEQALFKRQYRIRLLVVALFFLSSAGLVGIASLFPAFISAYTEELSQAKVSALIKKSQDSTNVARIQSELHHDAEKARDLAGSPMTSAPSEIIKQLATSRGQIRMSMISLDAIGTTTATIRLEGVAPTRESLVSFKTRLEGLAKGNKVELPISDFAKSKDISFSLRITYILQ